jgi:hypothetical protein
MKRCAWTLVLLASLSGLAFGGSICPGAPTGTTFPHPPDPSGTGCNVVITIAANGTASLAITDSVPYENAEDIIVGVVNNSASPVGSLSLTGTDIFGFEGDGICVYNFPGNGYCSAAAKAGTDPQDYQGPTSTFTHSNNNSGTVNFSPSIAANGGTTYFSLEGVPTDLNAIVGVGPGGPPPTGVPTLSTWVMFLTAGLLLALGLWQAPKLAASKLT